jgi:hypothetical protein
VPVLVLLWIHDLLGLSDAMMVERDQRDANSRLYNFVMVGVFYLGIGFFVIQALNLKPKGLVWVWLKFAFLAVYWAAILLFLYSRDG